MSDEKETIYRIRFIGRIENRWLRRAAILASLPFLFVLNCAIATASLAVFVVVHWWKNNRVLVGSAVLRWNARDDSADGYASINDGE